MGRLGAGRLGAGRLRAGRLRLLALTTLGMLALLGPALWGAAAGPAVSAPAERWKRTIERVSRGIVTLRVTMPRAFDHQPPGYQTATGFVVDAERGLILTNRHVVSPGPSVAEAVFLDNEEVPVRVVYRDPVHDFGLLQFDPADVRFMQVGEIPLDPSRARVGTEIRVIGNDAGERLSILAGTLARLDREAPPYGAARYNDFNTFYFQAASGTSGGSSGSPVIDVDGYAIALNAGANRSSASSFFLPLDRVVRALESVRRGEAVARGTLQVVFEHRPYDELRRLGLRDTSEAEARKQSPEGTGLLVVAEVVPGGPAAGILEPGDVLLSIADRPLDSFLPLEEVLDGAVGSPVRLTLERGGERRSVEVPVQNLHAITPSAYIEAGGAVLNVLSYQMARNFGLPVGGVYVAATGYALRRANVPGGSVLTQLGDRELGDLDDFARAWSSHPDGTRVPLRYFVPQNARVERVAVLEVDRTWFPARRCEEREPGLWDCSDLAAGPLPSSVSPQTTRFPEHRDAVLSRVAPSLVSVEFQIPYPVDGVHGLRFQGVGLVVDVERGLVVVDRETVPIALGDIALRFASSIRVPGELVYLHPEHNLAVVRYDPDRIGETPVRAAKLFSGPLEVGDETWLVGLTGREQPISRRTVVSRIEPLDLPLLRTPRFRETNLDVVSVADAIPTIGGVLADRRGRILALWASFSQGSGKELESFVRGIPIERVREIVDPLRRGEPVGWRSLGVEWDALSLADARDRGLPEELARQLERAGGARPQVLAVSIRAAGSEAARFLADGDLLVAVEGQPVTRFDEVERASQKPRVRLRIVRQGQVLEQVLGTERLAGTGTERALLWGGAVLQTPPRAIALQRGIERNGVYVSFFFYGSPANRYRLSPTRRILAVDGVPTPDLDAFVGAVAGKTDRDPVRLRVVDLEGKVRAVTLKLDLRYWPTYELVRRPPSPADAKRPPAAPRPQEPSGPQQPAAVQGPLEWERRPLPDPADTPAQSAAP